MTGALTFALDLTGESASILSPTPELPTQPEPKPKSSSSFVSFLTPKKNKTTRVPQSSEPSTPSKGRVDSEAVASPFGRHYQHTESIIVEPFLAPVPTSSSWTPAKSANWNAGEEDVFTSGWRAQAREPQPHIGDNVARKIAISDLRASFSCSSCITRSWAFVLSKEYHCSLTEEEWASSLIEMSQMCVQRGSFQRILPEIEQPQALNSIFLQLGDGYH